MKEIITKELVYFTGRPEKKRDFSGTESAFSESERIEFLNKYQVKARRWYQDDLLNQKAVEDNEVYDFLRNSGKKTKTSVRKTISFDKMTAQEVYKEPLYKGLHLYCGAELKENIIYLPKREIRPTPCALFEVEENVKSISLDVYIPEDYKCSQNERCGEAQAGRVIELRCGTLDKVKIKLCNSGEILSMSKDKWRPTYTFLGKVIFGGINSFVIEIGEKIEITANGQKITGIEPTCEGDIDRIFFDGGMFPRSGWHVGNITINGEKVIFEKNAKTEEILSETKEVALPYAIGGFKNRDKRVYLVKSFEVSDFKEAYLNIETLDPCGKAWINDELVLDTDSFTKNKVCVSKYIKKGINQLKIMVEPRAPEVYYFWHRHNDCYNGWFCGEVSLELVSETFISDMQIRTRKISPEITAEAEIELNKDFTGKVKLYCSKIYPKNETEKILTEKNINGDRILIKFTEMFDLWSDKTPELYNIRAVLCDENGEEIDDFISETGFRIIEQKNGGIYLNGEKIMLNGALQMQFLPPFDDVPVNHNCPTDYQIAWQAMMLKAMNGNLLRLHILGYGTNEERYARICDRLGVMLIWTTRFIDTLEEMVWNDGYWHEKKEFIYQIKTVANHPSIVLYEGSNEYHAKDLDVLNRMYDSFVDAVKTVDDTRLLTPVSHLYYGGGIYEMGCCYYSDDGLYNQDGEKAESGHGWRDKDVIRSAHTYTLLCGYGESWEAMRKQDWKWQPELLGSKEHSYLITEYAVTALPNPETDEAKKIGCIESYERPDEIGSIGRIFEQDEWKESQALQALCASQGVKLMRKYGVDGMAWCCLMSGANNGAYMKPTIDFYGYKKLGFYALRDAYRPIYAAKLDIDLSYGVEDSIIPFVVNCAGGGKYDLSVLIFNDGEELIDSIDYSQIEIKENENSELNAFKPKWKNEGYYTLKFVLKQVQ